MNKDLIERFKKSDIVINLETQEEWNEFMQWLEDNTDLMWAYSKEKPTKKNYWDREEEWTCVDSDMTWAAYNSFKNNDKEIIKYKDLKEKKGMKTSEFIKLVEELGFKVEEDFGLEIYYDGILVARVFLRQEYKLDTNYSSFTYLGNDIKLMLLNLMVEYSKTPLEKREEPKKYYITPKGMITYDNLVLGYDTHLGDWLTVSKSSMRVYKIQFTLKELEDLGIDVEHYDLEEVE